MPGCQHVLRSTTYFVIEIRHGARWTLEPRDSISDTVPSRHLARLAVELVLVIAAVRSKD